MTRTHDEVKRPSAKRVLRRAYCLSAVAMRGIVERDVGAQGLVDRAGAWLTKHGIDSELERSEKEFLGTPVGKASAGRASSASWRSEGLAVLAWVLGAIEMPALDVQIDPAKTSHALGFLEEPHATKLRDSAAIEAMGEQLFATHWRLVEYGLRPKAMDFVAFSKKNWFCKFDIRTVAIANKDLAIGGAPIAKAPADAVRTCMSIAIERHQAVNWLLGNAKVYSKVRTDT